MFFCRLSLIYSKFDEVAKSGTMEVSEPDGKRIVDVLLIPCSCIKCIKFFLKNYIKEQYVYFLLGHAINGIFLVFTHS
jgi:hypothetical protein